MNSTGNNRDSPWKRRHFASGIKRNAIIEQFVDRVR